MKQTRGISMISLVITILIIAILAAVMIPSGIDKINSAKLTSFNENILTLKQETNTYLMQNDEYPVKLDGSGNPVVYSISSNSSLVAEATKKNDQNDTFYIIDLDKVKLDNKDNGVGKAIDDFYIVAKTSGNVYYAKGQKIGNVTYYTKQNKGDGVIAAVPSGAPVPNGAFDGKVNAPKLATGMTAIKWNGSAWVNADSTNAGNDWYDYTLGVNKWANVKLADGSMLVWIPRYTYKIISGEHTSTSGVIDVKFSMGTVDDTSDGYRIHPAFYWGGWNIPANALMSKQPGGIEVTGIWVGKFEPSDIGNGKVQIKAGYASMRSVNVDTIFTKCMNMQNVDNTLYGVNTDRNNTDIHMMKNNEWGSVAYLSKFALGIVEVTINADSGYFTSGVNDTTGIGVKSNKSQSTTGTEYGIFDMSGCSWEYMACFVENANSNITTNGNLIYTTNPKYKDAFSKPTLENQQNNYESISQAFGYAMYETSNSYNSSSSWYNDSSNMMYNAWPWIVRGGANYSNIGAGLFAFGLSDGPGYNSYSFRNTAIVL